MKKFYIFISLVLLFVFFVNAYAVNKVAQTGCKFMDVGAGARACGMAEAVTVLGQDANALFYNPACVGKIDNRFELSVSMTKWIADINYIYLAAVYNAGIWGNFGLSIISPDYGEFIGTIFSDNEEGYEDIGLLDVSAFSLGLGYSRSLSDKFAFGLHVKYVSQHLSASELEDGYIQNRISTLAYDAGILFYPGFKSFAFGMSVRNFSPRVTYEQVGFELPLTFVLGVGMNILDLFGEYPEYTLNIGFEGLHPRDWEEQYHLGTEFAYKGVLFLRAGYKFNYYAEGLNAGIGLNLGGVRLDYSYSKHDLYDMINRGSAGFSF